MKKNRRKNGQINCIYTERLEYEIFGKLADHYNVSRSEIICDFIRKYIEIHLPTILEFYGVCVLNPLEEAEGPAPRAPDKSTQKTLDFLRTLPIQESRNVKRRKPLVIDVEDIFEVEL